MKKIIKITAWLVAFILILVSIFVAAMWVQEWTPDDVEYQSTGGLTPDTVRRSDRLKIVSWNIGYAGLGDDMDFFYDGGKSVRCSEDRTKQNFQGIVDFLKKNRDADFILLQEVDFDSKRSYHQNQYEALREVLPEFMGWWGLNYVSKFVPIPLFEPIGEVRAGVVTLSRHAPVEVVRLQYPGGFGFPTRLFNLKRCLLTAAFRIEGSDEMFYLGNTHNSAYDDGGMREGEIQFVKNFINQKPFSIIVGDWNSNPPQYSASDAELNDPNFSLLQIKEDDFPEGCSFLIDLSVKSVRYGYEPYRSGKTTTSIIDFAVANSAVEVISVETVDLGFRNSDHNPVIYRVALK